MQKPPQDSRKAAIQFLTDRGFPVLPVCPAQDAREYPQTVGSVSDRDSNYMPIEWYMFDPIRDPHLANPAHCPIDDQLNPLPLFTGKNPSFLDRRGFPRMVNHGRYQKEKPSAEDSKKWFVNAANGIGTLGGWNQTYWIDLDRKQFDSPEECDAAADRIFAAHEPLRSGWVEKTHSGGWRIAVKLPKDPDFTNFCLEQGGQHVGEIIGKGRFTVLAPTIGVSGNPYQNICRNDPPEVESLESIGIYPTGKKQVTERATQRPIEFPKSTVTAGTIALEDLGTDQSREVLNGGDVKGDRSESLALAIQEWAGWINWGNQNGIAISGDVELLAHYAGDRLGIDADRVDRILATVDPGSCVPSCLHRGDEVSAWKKIRRLDRATFDQNCPEFIRQLIANPPMKEPEATDDRSDRTLRQNQWNAPETVNHEIGIWVDAGTPGKPDYVFHPKCNFDFLIERVLQSENGGGLVLRITRLSAGELSTNRVIVPSVSLTKVDTFINEIKRGLGVNVSCLLTNNQLQSLIHVRTEEYRRKGGKTYKLIDRVGQQPDGTWVFENCQFTREGNPTSEEESLWVFNPRLGVDDFIPHPLIVDPSSEALPRLVASMREFFGVSGLMQALVCMGWVAAGLHYQQIIKEVGAFPLLNAYGDPGSNKTICLESALSIVGWVPDSGHSGLFSGVSESALYERLKCISGLPVIWDDPTKDKQSEEILKKLYNAHPRFVRGNYQEPHAALAVTSNHAFGDDSAATLSRLVRIAFSVNKDGKKEAFGSLRNAIRSASGALPSLIALGFCKEQIDCLADELLKYLPYAHARVARSLALVTWYGCKVAEMAGASSQDLVTWVILNLCHEANDGESTKDSLTDFLEKVAALQARSVCGEWNVRMLENGAGEPRAMAIHIADVWSHIEKHFIVSYSPSVLKRLIAEKGGKDRSTARFAASRDLWLAYEKAKMTMPVAPDLPKTVTRRCIEIPVEVVNGLIHGYGNGDGDRPQNRGDIDTVSILATLSLSPEESVTRLVTQKVTAESVEQQAFTTTTTISCNKVTINHIPLAHAHAQEEAFLLSVDSPDRSGEKNVEAHSQKVVTRVTRDKKTAETVDTQAIEPSPKLGDTRVTGGEKMVTRVVADPKPGDRVRLTRDKNAAKQGEVAEVDRVDQFTGDALCTGVDSQWVYWLNSGEYEPIGGGES